MMKYFASLVGLAAVTGVSTPAVQLLSNGNFETGNASGWTIGSTQSSPFQAALNDGRNSAIYNSVSGNPAWFIRDRAATYFNGKPAVPINGYSAFNGFDGSPGYFFLNQSFTIASPLETADLSFTFGIQSSYNGTTRIFTVDILDGNGASLASVFNHGQPTGSLQDWSVTNVSADLASVLNALGSGTYQLSFKINIPQNYTGPAQFAIDDISLNVTEAQLPEVGSTLALACLGISGLFLARKKQ